MTRTFFCRNEVCQKEAPGDPGGRIPAGWYSLARGVGDGYSPMVKLGLFCSLDCLFGHQHILQMDADRFAEFQKRTEGYRDPAYTR
jgi:hypothetical protein